MYFSKALIIVLAVLPQTLTAQSVEISTRDLFALSAQALRDGQVGLAVQGADALLAQNPDNVNALILRAETAIVQQDYAKAAKFAQRGYFASTTPQGGFATARLAALAHAQLHQDTRAQIWLRLARNDAPDTDTAQAVARDYQFLRNRNPWSTSLRFGITPSSNINNGSASATSRLFGLPYDFVLGPETRALSGYEFTGGFTTNYRLRSSQTSATFFAIDANARTYSLSTESKEQAPDVRGSDFADTSVSFGLTHRFVGRPGDQPTTLRFSAGQTWYGGDPNVRFVEIAGSHSWKISPEDRLSLGITLQRTQGLADQDPTQSSSITAGWTHAFASGDVSRLNFTHRVNQSDTLDADYTSQKFAANYTFAQPVFGINFGMGLEYEERHFDASRYDRIPREDTTTTARIRAVVTNVEYFGFQPVVTLEGTHTESNIDLFDRDYFRLGFDLQSSF